MLLPPAERPVPSPSAPGALPPHRAALRGHRAPSPRALPPHLLQEAEEKVPRGAVGGEEAVDGFVQHIGVEPAGGGGQSPQGSQDIARLLPRHGLLQLLHVLLDICGGTRDAPVSGSPSCSCWGLLPAGGTRAVWPHRPQRPDPPPGPALLGAGRWSSPLQWSLPPHSPSAGLQGPTAAFPRLPPPLAGTLRGSPQNAPPAPFSLAAPPSLPHGRPLHSPSPTPPPTYTPPPQGPPRDPLLPPSPPPLLQGPLAQALPSQPRSLSPL